ncbi:MAG TPA: hypothetical protein VK797_29135 [Tepidisphaeraceae bacterium]|jgi:hypothetical protein|nr:hypothetical protein [Tepidisphaeraceae bacterium]
MSSQDLTRRQTLQLAASAAIVASPFCSALAVLANALGSEEGTTLAHAAPYVQPHLNWSAVELDDFLAQLPPESLLSLKKALDLAKPTDPNSILKGGTKDVQEIQAQLLWVSSNIVTYPFRDEKKIAYHELVKWVADDAGVDQWILDTQSTFVIERAYQERLFTSLWDTLNVKQREELLSKIEGNGTAIADKAAIASLSGSGALAALSITVYFAGFTFYTTMSVVICTVAGWFGMTLPFAAYAAASSTVAFLTGPIGWAILAIAAAAGIALAHRANTRKTGAAICQLHFLKIAALRAGGKLSDDVFQALGDPIRRQLVGKWKWSTAGITIDFDLKGDGSFTCEDHPDSRPPFGEGYGFIHSGRGNWTVRDGKLTIATTQVWTHAVWWKHDKTWIDEQRIKNVSATQILLADGDRLRRE